MEQKNSPKRTQEIQDNYLVFSSTLKENERHELQKVLLESFKNWDNTTVDEQKGYDDKEKRFVVDFEKGLLVIRPQRAFISPEKKWFAKEKWSQPLMREILRSKNGYDKMFDDIFQ
jgi:hypothetical protein